MELLNPDMEKCIRVEFSLFAKFRTHFFSVTSYRDYAQHNIDNVRDWECSSFMFNIMMQKISASSMQKLQNQTSGTPTQGVRPIMLGMRKFFSNSSGFI